MVVLYTNCSFGTWPLIQYLTVGLSLGVAIKWGSTVRGLCKRGSTVHGVCAFD